MSVDTVSPGDWLLLACGLLLCIDLLFLPWFSVSVPGASESATATGDPSSWPGILAVMSTVSFVADLAIDRCLPRVPLPNVGGSRADMRFFLASMTAFFLAFKFILHLAHLAYLDFGFLVALVLTAALVYLAFVARNVRVTGSSPSEQRIR